MFRVKHVWVIGLVLLMTLAGCRESAQAPTATPEASITVELIPMEPVRVGATVLTVRLTGANNLPVTDAMRVAARGDMTHAGMQPVFGVAEEASNGEYRIAFEWTMAGDWIITVDVTMSDETTLTREFDVTVSP